MSMEVAAYLARIGFAGTPRADLATLTAIHRAHLFAVPFENLDVQLGRPLNLDPLAQFDKIVRRRRGGWCYEMNGVLGWALQQLGFSVTRLCGGGRRERLGDVQLGNHLALRVQLEQPYFVDVGYGGTLLAPLPLQVGERIDSPYLVALKRTEDDYWRFSETTGGEWASFDFRDEPADEAALARTCRELQESADSSFVQNLVVQQRTPDTHRVLRGRALRTIHASGTLEHLLASADELVTTLHECFALDVPEAASLWPAICARHAQLFPDRHPD